MFREGVFTLKVFGCVLVLMFELNINFYFLKESIFLIFKWLVAI